MILDCLGLYVIDLGQAMLMLSVTQLNVAYSRLS